MKMGSAIMTSLLRAEVSSSTLRGLLSASLLLEVLLREGVGLHCRIMHLPTKPTEQPEVFLAMAAPVRQTMAHCLPPYKPWRKRSSPEEKVEAEQDCAQQKE